VLAIIRRRWVLIAIGILRHALTLPVDSLFEKNRNPIGYLLIASAIKGITKWVRR
jgi:hypothetical protein